MAEKEIPETEIKMAEKEIPVTVNKNHVDLLQTIPDSWILRYPCEQKRMIYVLSNVSIVFNVF